LFAWRSKKEAWSRASTFFSCRCGVRARGCENNGSKVGLVSKKRAKFRRVVVDAKGQGEFGLLMAIQRQEKKRASRKRHGMGIITSPSREACHALARGLRFGSLRCASANETSFGKMVRCSSFAGARQPCQLVLALENPEPLQVLKRHVEDRDTACHRLPQHLNPPTTPLGQPCARSYRRLVCRRLG